MIESHWRALKRRLTRGGIRKETLADHFAEHIFMKDKEDVFMALVSKGEDRGGAKGLSPPPE